MTAWPTSHAEILAAIVPPGAAPPMVCGFQGNPKEVAPSAWSGWPWQTANAADAPKLNLYFTLGTFQPDEHGRYRRRNRQCAAVYGVMLDDIGTKVPLERLAALPPSVLIETSPGNYQAWYLLAEPATGRAAMQEVQALQAALIAAGLCDPGAHGPGTRWVRLPFGVNGKHSPPFPCRLAEWRPERRFTIEQIRAAFHLPDAPAKPEHKSNDDPRDDWLGRTEGQRAELVATLHSALAVIPSDDRDTWVKVGHCLRASLPDEIAYDMWAEWSAKSPKCDDDGLEAFWGFEPEHAGYAGVLTMAQMLGWANPARRDPDAVQWADLAALPATASPVPLPPAPQREVLTLQPPFARVSVADLWTRPQAPQPFYWGGYLPGGYVAMLGGHGGVRKSMLALNLAARAALGLPFLGLPTRKCRVLVFSAEDPGSLIRWRLARTCRDLGADPAALAESLHVLDATDGAPALFTEQRAGGVRQGVLTATYEALRQYVETHAIDLLIVDNASDTFDADEINRAAVRQFIQALARLVRARDGAVLLLAHVDKATSRAGKGASVESYSGSTAWHNSVRSRMFLLETGPGLYELQHQKSNLGPRHDPLTIMWGADGPPQVLEAAQVAGADDACMQALLRLIEEFASRGEYPSTSMSGRPTVAQMFDKEPTYPRHLRPSEVIAILRDAERRQFLAREQFKKPGRHMGDRFAITDLGRQFLAGALSATSAR